MILAGGLLVALSIPALGMQFKEPGTEGISRSQPIMSTLDRIDAAFPGGSVAATTVIKADDVTTPQIQAAIQDLQDEAIATGQLSEPSSVDISPDKTLAVVSLAIKGKGTDAESNRSLEVLREQVVPTTVGKLDNAEVAAIFSVVVSRGRERRAPLAARDGVAVSVAFPAREILRDAVPTAMRRDREMRALARTVALPGLGAVTRTTILPRRSTLPRDAEPGRAGGRPVRASGGGGAAMARSTPAPPSSVSSPSSPPSRSWPSPPVSLSAPDAPRSAAAAARLYGELAPFESRWVQVGYAASDGPVARSLGLLAAARGDLPRAAAHFEQALGLCTAAGAAAFEARARADLRLRRGTGERDESAM